MYTLADTHTYTYTHKGMHVHMQTHITSINSPGFLFLGLANTSIKHKYKTHKRMSHKFLKPS